MPWTNPPSQNTSVTYDARNARLQLVDGVTNATTVYDPDHTYQPAAVYTPTGSGREIQALYGYDARHRLVSLSYQACVLSGTGHACTSTTAAGSDTYTYDDNDNRTRVAEANGAASLDRSYCYDARDQLTTRGTGAGCTGPDESYTYDDAGNRLTAGATTFSYNADGQLTACSAGCGTIAHDSAGRMTSLAGWSFLYDAEGRMTSACQAASCTGSGFNRLDATYDGQGHRTQLRETTAAGAVTTTDFRYAGDAITAETVNGVLARTYVTDDTGRITKLCLPDCSGSNPVYLVTWNGHGDALALWRVNADGTLALANSYQYTTWGTPTTTVAAGFTDLSFRFLYVGASDVQWDNAFGLGLLYMHARHYSSLLSRFLQPDPSALEANLYGYAGNSPVTKVDPGGTFPLHKTGLGPNDIGKIGERFVKSQLIRAGWSIKGQQVRYFDGARIVDIEAQLGNKLAVIEVKANSGRRNLAQRTNDPLVLKYLARVLGPQNVEVLEIRVSVSLGGRAAISKVKVIGGSGRGFARLIGLFGGGSRHVKP